MFDPSDLAAGTPLSEPALDDLLLGELNDINIARERALGEAGLRDGGLAFAAGRVVGRRECEEGAILEAAVEGFKAFDAADPFWR